MRGTINPPRKILEVRKGIVICCTPECQRSQTIAPITMAMTSKAARTYLLAANHDGEGAAEVKKKGESSEEETFAGRSGTSETADAGVATASTTGAAEF